MIVDSLASFLPEGVEIFQRLFTHLFRVVVRDLTFIGRVSTVIVNVGDSTFNMTSEEFNLDQTGGKFVFIHGIGMSMG